MVAERRTEHCDGPSRLFSSCSSADPTGHNFQLFHNKLNNLCFIFSGLWIIWRVKRTQRIVIAILICSMGKNAQIICCLFNWKWKLFRVEFLWIRSVWIVTKRLNFSPLPRITWIMLCLPLLVLLLEEKDDDENKFAEILFLEVFRAKLSNGWEILLKLFAWGLLHGNMVCFRWLCWKWSVG